jgi:hypothetical protein
VADVFDALSSDRYYRKAMPICDAYDFVAGRGGRDFDPEVIDLFRTYVAPYPPGSRVVLSDGTCGLVKEVRQPAVRFPIVRIIMDASRELVTPWDVDLSKSRELTIVATEFELPASVHA